MHFVQFRKFAQKTATPTVQCDGCGELARRSDLILRERSRIRRRLHDLNQDGEELIIGSLERRLASVMMFCLSGLPTSLDVFRVSESPDAPVSGRLQRQNS